MVKKFIKKRVVVEAIQYNGNSNRKEIVEFVGKELKCELESDSAYLAGKGAPLFSLAIDTKEGVMKAMAGDWIIKEPFPTGDRDFYPCKNEIFKNTYDEMDFDPIKEMIQTNRSYTALELFVIQLTEILGDDVLKKLTAVQAHSIRELFTDSMEAEKKQIATAWDMSRRDIDYPADGIRYYNEVIQNNMKLH